MSLLHIRKHLIGWTVALLATISVWYSLPVLAACSVYSGLATLNEYYFGTGANFLEVFIKNISTVPVSAWQGWKIRVYTSSTTYTDYVLNDSTSTYCEFGNKAYITYFVPTSLPSPTVSAVLLDASGNEIDYVRVCGPPGSCTLPNDYTPDPAMCTSVDHDLQIDTLGNKDIARFPDGKGDWSLSSGTGSGTAFTACSTNNAGVTKVADTSAITVGSSVTFTINAVNNENKSDTFVITDAIPSGFNYVSATATQGSVDSSALPLLSWNVGTLAGKGGSASLVLAVTGNATGTYENTATLTSPCADPMSCPSDSATVLVESTASSDHFAIEHDGSGVTCEAELVTVRAHDAGHVDETAYAGTLMLSNSTGHGDWSLFSGNGVLAKGAADSGIASYAFTSTDNGVVQLLLKNTHVETININVIDTNGVTENSGSALPAEDQNLVFAQAGFRFIDAAGTPVIGTQIAGKGSATAPGAQSLYLQAIRTSDDGTSCTGVFTDGVTANIDLGSTCNDPASCIAGQRVVVTNTGSVAVANSQNQDAGSSYTSVPLTFTTNSRAPLVITYGDAGAIQLHARYSIPLDDGTPSGNFMLGSSNAFVVRPFGFELDFSGDRAANGTSGASYAADANGSIFQLAGAAFDTSLTAVAWNSADDTNSDGIPDTCADLSDNTVTANFGSETTAVIPASVTLTQTLVEPSTGGVPGTLITSASGAGFTAGVGSKTIAWSEVGIMHLNASRADYLGSGQAVQGNVCNVGRFYPKDFVIANATVTNRSDIALCADPFTYMDEHFTIRFDLQAYNAATPPALTQNYIGAFDKLDPAALGAMNYGATDSGTDYTARLGVSSAGVFTGGNAPVTATLALAKNAAPDGLYANMVIGIAPADSDGVSLRTLNLSLNGSASTHGKLGQSDIRYGRLILQNNFGSELLPLTMPLLAQYYTNGTTGFVTNADDNCTALSTADVLLYNDQSPKAGRAVGNAVISVSGAATTTLTGVSAFANGVSSLNFSTPGAEGYVDVEVQTPSWLQSDIDGIDQGVQGPGAHCTPGLAVSDPAYIAGCAANGNVLDDVPAARGSFGIFKGSDRMIYIREVY